MRQVNEIAREIALSWRNPFFGAVPYIQALQALRHINDTYGVDDARTIILYFLANAGTWRGEDARRIKAELKSML